MNISSINSVAFRGYLKFPTGEEIKTDDILRMREAATSHDSDILVKTGRSTKSIKAEGIDYYQSLIPAYIAACQNKKVHIALSETYVKNFS